MSIARRFILKGYGIRQKDRERERARYLRKLAAPVCKLCYGLPHRVTGAVCKCGVKRVS